MQFVPPTGSKLTRAIPFASAVENGLVRMVRGDWNEEYLKELHAFTGTAKDTDDQVDASADAFNDISKSSGGLSADQF